MRKGRVIAVFGLLVVLTAPMGGCKKKNAQNEKKAAKFHPGKMVPYKNDAIGFSLLKPANVKATVKGETVEFTAKGFPKVVVTFQQTKINATGGGTSSGGGSYKRVLQVPMRKLTCQCDDTGDFEKLVEKMCGSMKNTKSAPKHPKVVFKAHKLSGKVKAPEEVAKAVAAARPKIETCWKNFVKAHPDFAKAGNVNYSASFDKTGKRVSSSLSQSFNDKNASALMSCIRPAMESIAIKADDKPVTFSWAMDFKLY